MNLPTTSINVIIADDHFYFREGLKLALGGQKEIQIVAEASNGKELYALAQRHTPDVIVTDISMPELSGIEVTRLVRAHYPQTKIIALSMHEEASVIRETLLAGAHAYVLKHADISEVMTAIHTAHRGKFYVSTTTSHYLDCILQYSVTNQSLTQRETEIIQMLFEELTNKEIGERLYISERTVEDHRKNIQKKVKAKNVVGVIKHAIRNRIVELT